MLTFEPKNIGEDYFYAGDSPILETQGITGLKSGVLVEAKLTAPTDITLIDWTQQPDNTNGSDFAAFKLFVNFDSVDTATIKMRTKARVLVRITDGAVITTWRSHKFVEIFPAL
jgi:hypothetical protein